MLLYLVEDSLLSQESDSHGVYLLNVAVDPEWRGRGCGKVMLEAAEELIWKRWGAERIYAHVSKSNEVKGATSL